MPDWKTAVFILPFTLCSATATEVGLEDCRIITSFYLSVSTWSGPTIGRLPYYYFLLLGNCSGCSGHDWKTAVLLLPFT